MISLSSGSLSNQTPFHFFNMEPLPKRAKVVPSKPPLSSIRILKPSCSTHAGEPCRFCGGGQLLEVPDKGTTSYTKILELKGGICWNRACGKFHCRHLLAANQDKNTQYSCLSSTTSRPTEWLKWRRVSAVELRGSINVSYLLNIHLKIGFCC
jgi:hypothetical protein